MTLTNDTITNKYRSLKYIYQYKNVFDKPDEQSQTCLNCHGGGNVGIANVYFQTLRRFLTFAL